jgi:peptidoglycan biosynthesis protein MviN/MurJ (putative lipid II flippase)
VSSRPLAGRVAITSIAQLGTMAFGGLLALLIARRFGTSSETDAMFAAYSVYGVFLMVAQSLRLTMVPRLARAEGAAASFVDGLGALAVIAAVSAVALIGFRHPLATVLVGSDGATDVTGDALAVFWGAAMAQLVAGYGAAQLAASGQFTVTAVGYLTGSLLPVLALAVWPDPDIGIVPLLIGGGAVVTALVLVAGVAQQPKVLRERPSLRGSLSTASQMVAGALGSVMWQIALVASLAFAARTAEGAVTVYPYAFFAAGLVTAVTSGSIAMVIAGPITSGWDRLDPAPLEPALLSVVRTSTLLAVPILGVALLVADDVIGAVLGSALTDDEVATMRDTFLALGGVILAAGISPVPAIAAYARARYWTLAGIALVGLALHIGLSAVAAAVDSVVALAAVASFAALAIGVMTIWLIWRDDAAVLIARVTRAMAEALAVGAAAFVPLLLLASLLGSVVGAVVGAAVGCVVYAALVRRLLPEHWTPVVGAVSSLLGR